MAYNICHVRSRKKSFMREQLQFVFNYFIVINIILLQYLYQLESDIRPLSGHIVIPLLALFSSLFHISIRTFH